MSHEHSVPTREFEYPTEDKWGLTPDEQVFLFANPEGLDSLDNSVIGVMNRKADLAYRYLASFWQEDVPQEWHEIRDEEAKSREEFVRQIRQRHGDAGEMVEAYPSTTELAVRHDSDTGGWFKHHSEYQGAYLRAVEQAYAAACAGDEPEAAVGRLVYIAKMLEERNEYRLRGDRFSGVGSWVELPEAPWKCDMTEYPIRQVEPDRLF